VEHIGDCPNVLTAPRLIRCRQITEGDAIIRASTVDVASITPEEGRAARKKTNRGAERVEKGRGDRRRRRRRTRRVSPSLVRPRLTLITHSGHGVVRHS